MLTDVWYSCCVRLKQLHRHNRTVLNARLSDNKSIGVLATFEDFLLLDILLKVGDCINPCGERPELR